METVKIVHQGPFPATCAGFDVPLRSVCDSAPIPQGRFSTCPAPVVLPIAATSLLLIGALVAITGGGIGPTAMLVLVCLVVGVTAVWAPDLPYPSPWTVVVAEFTAIGFAHPALCRPSRRTPDVARRASPACRVPRGLFSHRCASARHAKTVKRRRLAGVRRRKRSEALIELQSAASASPASVDRCRLRRGHPADPDDRSRSPRVARCSLADDLLLYLLVVIGVSAVGGFWPAVVTYPSAFPLNWFLTPRCTR